MNEYFPKQTEEFILQYQVNKDDILFSNNIYPIFKELAKNVIRSFDFKINLYSENDLINIVTTQLYLKINKYKSGNAFKYFTSVAKNYLIDVYRYANKRENISIDVFLNNDIL